MKRTIAIALLPLVVVMTIAACQEAKDSSTAADVAVSDAPASLLEIISGRGLQHHVLESRRVWARTGASGSALPKDSLSYVGRSKALLPGARHDIYYVAVAGPTDTVGRVLCQATADLTLSEIDAFAPTERLLLTVTWGPNDCGWGGSGDVFEQVYAWVDSTSTLHLWEVSSERPANMTAPWLDEAVSTLKLCEEPTVALAGLRVGHPSMVCDPELLFGSGNYLLKNSQP